MSAAERREKYVEIADELSRRIDAGIIGPAAPFPSELAIQREFSQRWPDLSRGTVRRALEVLRGRGRVYAEKGRGYYLKPQLPVRVISMARYREDMAAAPDDPQAYTAARDEVPAQHRPDVTIAGHPADDEVATLFGVPRGTLLLRRDLVHRIDGFPVQLATSFYLLDMVAGTWVATPESEPSPGGAVGHLKALGVRPTRVVKRLRTRYPTAQEAEALRLASGEKVYAITRQIYADDRVVEVSREIVIPDENVVLEMETDL